MNVHYFDSPIGVFGIAEEGGVLTTVHFKSGRDQVADYIESISDSMVAVVTPTLAEAQRQIEDYFTGNRLEFDLPYSLEGLSYFSQIILKDLATIPSGKILTYAELAARVGRPKASRAVGRVMATNPLPLIIPCHRVLAAGNRLNGYSGGDGIRTKEWLLNHEGVKDILQK